MSKIRKLLGQETLEGDVEIGPVGQGLNPTRLVVWLKVNKSALVNPKNYLDQYIIVRQGASYFVDPVLNAYDGKYIEITGYIAGNKINIDTTDDIEEH